MEQFDYQFDDTLTATAKKFVNVYKHTNQLLSNYLSIQLDQNM